MWWMVAESADLGSERSRLHTLIEERAITIFRIRGKLSAIDSVCAHAGGALTDGRLEEIEDLGITAVACPLHRYLFAVSPVEEAGAKVYQALAFVGGKPDVKNSKWTTSSKPQSAHRSHRVVEKDGRVYLENNDSSDAIYASDASASTELCTRQFTFHDFTPVPQPDFNGFC